VKVIDLLSPEGENATSAIKHIDAAININILALQEIKKN